LPKFSSNAWKSAKVTFPSPSMSPGR
jgi:hypothetical protein